MSILPSALDGGKHCPLNNSMLDWALYYASRKWRVLPLHTPTDDGCSCQENCGTSRGKHPRISNGSKGASADTAKIHQWWSKWPDANIGLATGPESGILALDVDGVIGQQSLTRFNPLPSTLTARSGRIEGGKRTGLHHLFAWPATGKIRNSAGLIGKKLDIRGMNGYIVASPSLHLSGRQYEWIDIEQPLIEAPLWLVTAAVQPGDEALSLGEMSLFYGDERNAMLLRMAGKWRCQGLEYSALLNKLRVFNEQKCRPFCSDEKLIGIAKSSKKWLAGGPDSLEVAAKKLAQEQHHSSWSKFRSLLWHLEEGQPGLPILLPVQSIAKIIGCDHTLVGRHRKRAMLSGILGEREKYNHLAGKATRFDVLIHRSTN